MIEVLAKKFIPGNVASSKNSKRIIRTGNFPRLIDSKISLAYKEDSGIFYANSRHTFKPWMETLDPPYHFAFQAIRQSKRRFDYANMAQAPLDLMVKHGILTDDDSRHVKPHFLDPTYDKAYPGLWVFLLSGDPTQLIKL